MMRGQRKEFEFMSNIRKKLTYIFVVIALLVMGIVAFIFWPTPVTREEAREIALTHVGGGHANPPERDFERFQRVWSVEVFYDGFVHEVFVNSRTGEVILVEFSN